MVKQIIIGPAGTGGSNLENFEELKKAGLGAVEIEFTYGVWMSPEQANKIAKLNEKLKLKLSIHAPYFINLNSEEKQKVGASRSRILRCCKIGHLLKARYIVFHPGFYQAKTKEQTYDCIKEQIIKIQKEIKDKKYNVYLAPETTGKPSQFGDLDELLRLVKETHCSICVDFAHLKARNNGKIDYEEIMSKLKRLKEVHCHFSGIEWTQKGERRHLLTEEKDIKELFFYLKKYKLKAIIINESPQPFKDAIKMKSLL